MKKLLLAVLAIAIVGGIGAVLLVGNLDRIVGDAIETVGSRATKAPVTVETVDLQVAQGTGMITGVSVGNPEGFETERAFAFDAIAVELDPGALTRSPVVVRRVTIERCDVTYEWRLGGSNMTRLRENVRAYVGRDRTIRAAKDGEVEAGVVIEELVIVGGTIDLTASSLGTTIVALPLDRIVLHDLGAAEGGATAAEITAAVVRALTRGVIDAVAGAGIDGVKDAAKSILEGAQDIPDDAIGK